MIKKIVSATQAYLDPETIVIVCSKENVGAIIEILENLRYQQNIRYVIQPAPTGPIDAVKLALPCCHSKFVNIICADNIIPSETWEYLQSFKNHSQDVTNADICMATKQFPLSASKRFTVYDPIQEELFTRGPRVRETGLQTCWVGPVCIRRHSLIKAFKKGNNVTSFEELFNKITKTNPNLMLTYKANVIDIGVPGELK